MVSITTLIGFTPNGPTTTHYSTPNEPSYTSNKDQNDTSNQAERVLNIKGVKI